MVEAYVKVRTTKDEKFIREYSHKDEEYKEEKRKEKRRLQDQLRRIKRNEERQKQGIQPKKQAAPPKPKPVKESLQKMKCSACGEKGHMKTNKNCPLYGKTPIMSTVPTVGDMLGAHQDDGNSRSEVTEVEGTKLRIKKAALAEKSFLKMKIPKNMIKPLKKPVGEENLRAALSTADSDNHTDDGSGDDSSRPPLKFKGKLPKAATARRKSTMDDIDYLAGPHKSVHRRRADPKVLMATTLGEIYTELKSIPGSEALMYPVNAKRVPDYYNVIANPMDMQQIHKKITSNSYQLRNDFLIDVRQMLQNSFQYNGENHQITQAAKNMFAIAGQRVQENETKLVELEKQINPLLHEDDMVGFSYILEEIVEACKNVPKSAAFHTKVDARKVGFNFLLIHMNILFILVTKLL